MRNGWVTGAERVSDYAGLGQIDLVGLINVQDHDLSLGRRNRQLRPDAGQSRRGRSRVRSGTTSI